MARDTKHRQVVRRVVVMIEILMVDAEIGAATAAGAFLFLRSLSIVSLAFAARPEVMGLAANLRDAPFHHICWLLLP